VREWHGNSLWERNKANYYGLSCLFSVRIGFVVLISRFSESLGQRRGAGTSWWPGIGERGLDAGGSLSTAYSGGIGVKAGRENLDFVRYCLVALALAGGLLPAISSRSKAAPSNANR
jgi:hypothetical protein